MSFSVFVMVDLTVNAQRLVFIQHGCQQRGGFVLCAIPRETFYYFIGTLDCLM